VVQTVTNELACAPGFASAFSMSGLGASGMTAAAMWRPTTAAVNAAGRNSAHAVNAAATLHTQINKQYVVTTPDAGRGNKGTSPWRFPV
jgi:hypothetical protein